MKVRELIEVLATMDPEAPVMTGGTDWVGWCPLSEAPRLSKVVPVTSAMCDFHKVDEAVPSRVTGPALDAVLIG